MQTSTKSAGDCNTPGSVEQTGKSNGLPICEDVEAILNGWRGGYARCAAADIEAMALLALSVEDTNPDATRACLVRIRQLACIAMSSLGDSVATQRKEHWNLFGKQLGGEGQS